MKIKTRTVIIFFTVLTLPPLILSSNGSIQMNRIIINFPIPRAEDLNKGFLDIHHSVGRPDLSIQTNVSETVPWNLYITTEHPFFMPVRLNKPHYDLLWKLSSEPDSKFRPLALQRVRVASGKSSLNVNLDFRLKIGWNDPPAEYSIEIMFELETLKDQIISSTNNNELSINDLINCIFVD